MPIFGAPVGGIGGGSATTAASSLGSRFAFFGDSITNYNETFGIYAAWLSGGKIEPVRFVSHPGYNSTQLAALIQSEIITPGGIDTVVIECGTNDTNNNGAIASLTAFAANMTSMVAAVKAAGLSPVVLNVPPRTSNTVSVTAFNEWLSRFGSAADVIVVDIFSALADPATGTYLAAMASGDGVHPSAAGNKAIGLAVANAVTPLIGAPSFQTLPFAGAPNLLSNSQFLAGSTTPTGYGAASGTGVTPTLVTDSRGFKWRRVTLASAGAKVGFGAFEVAAGAGTFAVGDRMRFSARLRMSADLASPGAVNDGMAVRATCYTAGYASSPLDTWLTGPPFGWQALTRSGEGVLSAEFVVPATTAVILISNTVGPQDGVYEDAQPTLLNLTKLGVV